MSHVLVRSLDSAAWEKKLFCVTELKGSEGPWAENVIIDAVWESEVQKYNTIVTVCVWGYVLVSVCFCELVCILVSALLEEISDSQQFSSAIVF